MPPTYFRNYARVSVCRWIEGRPSPRLPVVKLQIDMIPSVASVGLHHEAHRHAETKQSRSQPSNLVITVPFFTGRGVSKVRNFFAIGRIRYVANLVTRKNKKRSNRR